MRLEHVNLTVVDLDRTIAFYCDLLDLSVRWKGPIDEKRMGAHVGDDNFYLALFEATSPGSIEIDYGRPGVNHYGFVVDDLDAARARLQQLGATIQSEADYAPGRRLYFLDPDGYEVELVAYP
jgi:catechol 2,3-dioxygenase-like lactoylglutathione lyase family enzyme